MLWRGPGNLIVSRFRSGRSSELIFRLAFYKDVAPGGAGEN